VNGSAITIAISDSIAPIEALADATRSVMTVDGTTSIRSYRPECPGKRRLIALKNQNINGIAMARAKMPYKPTDVVPIAEETEARSAVVDAAESISIHLSVDFF